MMSRYSRYSFLVAECRPAECRPIRYWLSVIRFFLSNIRYQASGICYLLSAIRYVLLFAIGYLLSSCQNAEEVKRSQYFVEGMELYKVHCANCHQMDGNGLKNLYPPIANSDYLAGNKEKLMCGIKFGINDTLTINGKAYSQAMPANALLKDLEIAEILTFIYNKWGNEKVITETDQVKKQIETCRK